MERDYLTTVTGIRRSTHIWAWAINRHGPVNALLGWLIACDAPATADRPRNPGGWFTRFATAERPWNLQRNLRQLAQAAAASAASTARSQRPGRRQPASTEPAATPEPLVVEDEDAAGILEQYNIAWVRLARQRLRRERGEAVKAFVAQRRPSRRDRRRTPDHQGESQGGSESAVRPL